MKQPSQNLYEGMYVISARLSDDARKKALERLQDVVKHLDGEIVKIHDWGRRKLAYEINGHREGYYYIIFFRAPPSAVQQLWHEYHLNEDLIRFITLAAEEVAEKIEFKSLVEQ